MSQSRTRYRKLFYCRLSDTSFGWFMHARWYRTSIDKFIKFVNSKCTTISGILFFEIVRETLSIINRCQRSIAIKNVGKWRMNEQKCRRKKSEGDWKKIPFRFLRCHGIACTIRIQLFRAVSFPFSFVLLRCPIHAHQKFSKGNSCTKKLKHQI